MRKVIVALTIKMIVTLDDDISVSQVINELDYNFSDTTTKADVVDTEIIDYQITDSK